jgi:hypothetical protein
VRLINELLVRIFLDHFFVSSFVFASLTVALIFYRIFRLGISPAIAMVIWYFIVCLALGILVFLIIEFFSSGQGTDRLATIPLMVATSPLFLCFVIALFFYPRAKIR